MLGVLRAFILGFVLWGLVFELTWVLYCECVVDR